MDFLEFTQTIPDFTSDMVVALSGEPSGVPCTSHYCSCFSIDIDGTGGAIAGGVADVVGPELITGGCIAGGCGADIDIVDRPYDGLEAIYPLNESGSGVADEFKDRTTHLLHGQGGDGTATQVPTQDDGIFCQCSQLMAGRQFIKFAEDSIPITQDCALSGWAKITSFGKERSLFTRGVATAAFSLQHNFFNGVQAIVNTDVAEYQGFGETIPTLEKWTHFSASLDGGNLNVFLDGVLEESLPVVESSTVSYQGGNYAGKYESAGFPVGNLQELRVFPDKRDANWFKAERDNFCSAGFFVIGDAGSGASYL